MWYLSKGRVVRTNSHPSPPNTVKSKSHDSNSVLTYHNLIIESSQPIWYNKQFNHLPKGASRQLNASFSYSIEVHSYKARYVSNRDQR